tara:strand:+ start:5934 stop:6302 length:369 start_codon:yes stop_codon:yes gene_type:complete
LDIVSITSNISEAYVILLILVVDTPVSFDNCMAKDESASNVLVFRELMLIGLEILYPNVLSSANEAVFDVDSNLVLVPVLSNENESEKTNPLSLTLEKSVAELVINGLLPIAFLPAKYVASA